MLFLFFFFKQKTAYEMRISDWSSDVCSSDLGLDALARALDDLHIDAHGIARGEGRRLARGGQPGNLLVLDLLDDVHDPNPQNPAAQALHETRQRGRCLKPDRLGAAQQTSARACPSCSAPRDPGGASW